MYFYFSVIYLTPQKMAWMRYYAKKIFGPYLGYMPPEKAAKYMAISRMLYFFSASTLLFVYMKFGEDIEQQALESGRPVIQDHSEAHRLMRIRGNDAGIFYEYTPGKGLTKFEVNKNEYYQQLEKEAYERAKVAQEKAISEGRELPPEAIKLV